MSGYEDMPKVVANAPDDIRHHLWSLYWICRSVDFGVGPGRKVIELGVRGGDSTRAILAALKHTKGKLVSYDIKGDIRDVRKLTQDMGIPWEDGIWECRKGDSVEAGEKWTEGYFDILFVDTLHTYDHTIREIQAWEKFVRGAIILHDTGNTEPHQNGVRPAIDAFLANRPASSEWLLEDYPCVAERDVGLGILWRVDR